MAAAKRKKRAYKRKGASCGAAAPKRKKRVYRRKKSLLDKLLG